VRPDDGRGADHRGGGAGRVLLLTERRAHAAVPRAGRVKALLLDGRDTRELLAGFEVVAAPQEDVVAVLTLPTAPVGPELCERLPALRVGGTASVGFDPSAL